MYSQKSLSSSYDPRELMRQHYEKMKHIESRDLKKKQSINAFSTVNLLNAATKPRQSTYT